MSINSDMVRVLDKRFYPATEDRWDAAWFRKTVLEHLQPDARVLDFGAGRGHLPELDLQGQARFVAAVDVSDEVLGNPHVQEARRLLPGGRIPYDDASFDMVLAHNVLEHLPDPTTSFREIARVLKPHGVFIAKTPNRWHYVTLAARMTPHGFHQWWNRGRGIDDQDTFPTVYRCNTPSAIRRCAAAAGLTVEQLEIVEGRPEYLRHIWFLYPIGILYERVVSAFGFLKGVRVVMLAVLRKR